jgi:hypothetical protein
VNPRQALRSPATVAALIGAVAGVLLLLTLFMSWAQIRCAREPCPYPTGWETLEVLAVVIAVLAAAAVVVAVLSVLGQTARTGLVLAAIGGLAALLIILAPLVDGASKAEVDFGGGWTLGLLTAFAVLVSGLVIWVLSSGILEGEE